MDDILLKVKEFAPIILEVLGALVLVATVIVRATPSPADDASVSSIAQKFFKVVNYLPTLGINPRTKKIEETYNELKNKNA